LDGAGVRAEHVQDHAQRRGLARAVGPQEAEGDAARHGQGQVLHGLVAGEGLVHAGETDRFLAHAGFFRARILGKESVSSRVRGDFPGKERGVAEPAAVPRAFRLGVQTKLLAVVLLCVTVPVLTLGLFLMRRNREVLREKVEDGLSSHLLRKQSAFDDWMRDRAQEATRWSASFVVYEGLDAFAKDSPESRAARDLKSYLGSLLVHYRVYESLFIVDGQGRVLTGTREEQLEDWARPLVQGEVSFDGVLVSPLRKSQLLGRPTQLLLRPIPPPGSSERRGRALGYFVERLDLREMESMLAEDATDLAPAPWLLDAEGHILARAGKVVDDAGTRTFPIPDGTACAGRAGVVQGTL